MREEFKTYGQQYWDMLSILTKLCEYDNGCLCEAAGQGDEDMDMLQAYAESLIKRHYPMRWNQMEKDRIKKIEESKAPPTPQPE